MKLPKIVKDGMTLIGGNVWAQVIAFVAYLVLGRLYSPEDFAAFNIFYSYIEVLIILSTCKYELSVVVAKDGREAMAAARLALILNALVSVVLLSVVALMWLLGISVPIAYHIVLLIPFMVFFCGTSRVYANIFNRYKSFGQIALSEVLTSTSGVVAKIAMAFLSCFHALGLPLGTVLGKMVGNVNYLVKLRTLDIPRGTLREELVAVAHKFRNFPLFNMTKELLNSFSYNLPFLWLALYFADDPAVGVFGLALTFTFRPINILNTAFEKLLYVRVAECVREGISIGRDIRRFVCWLNVVALPFVVLLFFVAEPLFVMLFGHKWQGIGYFVQCLLPWVLVALTSTSLSFLANVFGQQKTELYFHIVLLVLRALAMVYGIMTLNFKQSILLFSLVSAVVCLLLLLWYLSLVRRHDRSILQRS